MSTNTFNTFVDLLLHRGKYQPQDIAFTYLQDNLPPCVLTYQDLNLKSKLVSEKIRTIAQVGDRVLLIYPSGIEFIIAFFGCLYAGVIAVPIYPPRMKRGSNHQLRAVCQSAEPSLILTESSFLDLMRILKDSEELELPWIFTDTLENNINNDWEKPNIREETIALLQYTSGSTGSPKGVMVEHGHLLHNQAMIKEAFGHHEKTIVAGWLPFYHDMGLIGNILQPVYIGSHCILMSPMSFLQRPFSWLKAISDYRATTSGGPNFAYELCVNKITMEQKKSLDLSSWEVAFNGSEPVKSEVIEKFSNYFQECNFRKKTFYPCYGMAETTLFVSGGKKEDEPIIKFVDKNKLTQNKVCFIGPMDENCVSVVGCGYVRGEQEVIIVSPQELRRCSNEEVGEIWLSGCSIARGYWNKLEETDKIFNAYLKDEAKGPFLRTGDLGFLSEDELFISGRLKDLIIIRGRNYYPQDIESIVKHAHPSLIVGGCAAISIEVDGSERLVILQEVERSQIRALHKEEVLIAIQKEISKECELSAHTIMLLKPGQIPKTSSGKIKRFLCRQYYLNNSFEVVASHIEQLDESIKNCTLSSFERLISCRPEERYQNLEKYFIKTLANILKVDSTKLSSEQSLDTLGIDSLYAVNIQSTIETELGVCWPITRFLQNESIDTVIKETIEKIDWDRLSNNKQENYSSSNRLPPEMQELELSFTQKAIWFAYQTSGKNSAYHISIAGRILNKLDRSAWVKAWERLLDRHAILRTNYYIKDTEIKQRIVPLSNHGMNVLHTASSDTEILRMMQESSCKPFLLESELPIRVSLFNSSQGETSFLLTLHHIAADLASVLILIDEFSALYNSYLRKSDFILPSFFYSYFDHIHTELIYSKQNNWEESSSYWVEKLSGNLSTLNLPIDHSRGSSTNFRAGNYQFSIDHNLTLEINNFIREKGVTLYVFLLTIYYVLLYRNSAETDLIVGTPTSGRSKLEEQHVVGCMINLVALRINLSGDLSFNDLLIQVREVVHEALTYQDFSFQKLLEKIQPSRETGRTPIFQTLFMLQETRSLQEKLSMTNESELLFSHGDFLFEWIVLPKLDTPYELVFVVESIANTLRINIEYALNLFDITTIKRIGDNFETLIKNVLSAPYEEIQKLPILSEMELNKIVKDWNNKYQKYPENELIHSLFSIQAQKSQNDIALQCSKGEMSYIELENRSNQLAHYLSERSIKPETLIGVLLDRDCDLMIVLLAILKIGATYLPFDVGMPADRLQFIIDDANVQFIITQRTLVEKFPVALSEKIISFDTEKNNLSRYSISPIHVTLSPNNAAYVIYTSGSTGKPKGVVVTHNSIINFLFAMQHHLQLTRNDSWLAITTIAFDISVLELFLPLIIGAKVIIVRQKDTFEGMSLLSHIKNFKPTVLQATPSSWRLILAAGWPENFKLKILVGGEALTSGLAEALVEKSDRLWNVYGPTEATIWATLFEVTSENIATINNSKYVPIGHPLHNVQIYVLDRFMKPTPIGVAGELYIGGLGVTKGYLNRDQLTLERFIPNLYDNGIGSRFYKTGDIGYFLPDGNVVFLGRLDNQVKIRGYRIELEEIEIFLVTHDSISECAIVAIDNPGVGTTLVAFLITIRPVSIQELHQFLTDKLPSYMVPTAYQFVESLPHTHNNKVDRNALTKFSFKDYNTGVQYIPPRTEEEAMVVRIWQRVLKREKISINDNFFQLGGHSLTIMEVLNLLKNDHGIILPIQDFFSNPTIELLAKRIVSMEEKFNEQHQKLNELFNMVKNLSDEDAKILI